jgi:hypothetical protein
MRLKNNQVKELREALIQDLHGFDGRQELELLMVSLDLKPQLMVDNTPLNVFVSDLINFVEREGLLTEFVNAAIQQTPEKPSLKLFAESSGILFDDSKQNRPSPQTSFLGTSVEYISQLADEAFSSAAKDFNK